MKNKSKLFFGCGDIITCQQGNQKLLGRIVGTTSNMDDLHTLKVQIMPTRPEDLPSAHEEWLASLNHGAEQNRIERILQELVEALDEFDARQPIPDWFGTEKVLVYYRAAEAARSKYREEE